MCVCVLYIVCVFKKETQWSLPHSSARRCIKVLTVLSLVLQFGSSFATFRPALAHSGSMRPLSVILPASPPYNRSPGSNTSSPTSKVPCWKVCSSSAPFIFIFSFWCVFFIYFDLRFSETCLISRSVSFSVNSPSSAQLIHNVIALLP